jgi:hypothetical protein
MSTRAGSRSWHHARAHRFFSRARWSADAVGLVLFDLVLACLVGEDEPLVLVVDDTLLKRSGRKVFGCAWHYDAAANAAKGKRFAWGNNWVVLALIVRLPFLRRPLALPLLFRLWRPHDRQRTKPKLACELVELIAKRQPKREIALIGDAAYASKAFATLPEQVSLTSRLRRDAALYQLAPPRTGKRGRPRLKGERLPALAEIAADPAGWQALEVSRYGRRARVELKPLRCLWYAVFGPTPVQIVLVREPGASGFDVALVSTDPHASAGQLLERYASRWAIEVCFEEGKQLAGVGEAQNRTEHAVERTAPFCFLCLSLAIVWYALHGHAPSDVADHRARAPWYRTKHHPSVADMLAKLRREIIAAQNSPGRGRAPNTREIKPAQQTSAAATA